MDLFQRAKKAHYVVTCRSIRNVLYECAAESLRKLVINKTKDKEEQPTELVINKDDIDKVNAVAMRIGRKWASKMMLDDQFLEYKQLLDLVLSNGHFLDVDYQDDLTSFFTDVLLLNDHEIQDEENDERNLEDSDKIQGDVVNEELNAEEDSHVENTSTEEEISVEGIKRSIPYATLLRLGQTDPCNLSSSRDVLQNGTSDHWHPLPNLDSQSSSLVHIPNPSLLPENKVQKIDEDQVFGRPALHPPKPLDRTLQSKMMDKLANMNHVVWQYPWDTILNLTSQIEDRLHPFKKKKEMDAKTGKIATIDLVPRTLLREEDICNHEATSNEGNGDDSMNALSNRQSGEPAQPLIIRSDDDGNISMMKNKDMYKNAFSNLDYLRKKRKIDFGDNESKKQRLRKENVIENGEEPVDEVGRQPSSVGECTWTNEEVHYHLGLDVRKDIENNLLHKEDEIMTHSQTCHGALKEVGSIHLYEQYSEISQDKIDLINSADKTIRRAHRKAKQERLYPIVEDTMKRYEEVKSKVLSFELDPNSQVSRQTYELDMMDCVVTFASNISTREEEKLAFKSLEIRLYEPEK
ncbi:predicted protein [Chaetoceros tenuissimus]|uniref:Uncharacterized protein n=1 Tax=Chaetoceros tenuissimus TaxID=426638 RepID=A0AAD3HDG1_9STRA|nr:predicted protein [Chaetoceros tenuissimus]